MGVLGGHVTRSIYLFKIGFNGGEEKRRREKKKTNEAKQLNAAKTS